MREMRITRLSQGVDQSGTLNEASLERSFDVLRQYRELMDVHDVTSGLLVATSAVRDASNGAYFLEQAELITGVPARLLSGNEEATFSYAGASADLPPGPDEILILDIGGGSTEVASKINGSLKSFSMQLGCVRVTERALGKGVVDAEHERSALTMISSELDRAFAAVPEFALITGQVRLVGLAGTVATLAQLDAGLDHYDRDRVHHRTISISAVKEWKTSLSAMTPEQRLALPGMVAGREDVLHSGLYILEAVMERFGCNELISSENDILDGIASSLR